MQWRSLSVVLVWVVAVVAAVLSVSLFESLRLSALSASLAGLILLTFFVQFTVRGSGAVRRIVLSVGGSVLILIVAMLLAETVALFSS